jgi:hypothetical protein
MIKTKIGPILFLKILAVVWFCFFAGRISAQDPGCGFKVIAFYTAKNDPAHISFVEEANIWFATQAGKLGFCYEATARWEQLNHNIQDDYHLVIFLDTRPEGKAQREAFERYMRNGGAWMGFHFAGFALNGSDVEQDWDWYHNEFLGSGQYKSNTWRPTSATLRIEDLAHPVTEGLPETMESAPNEWYCWEKDLRKNGDIQILLSIDPLSFPLGTGPKPQEIWHEGDYPVVWTNGKYRMIYFNMGHNDMDYEGGTNQALSSTFSREDQNSLISNALLWLGPRE